MEAFAAAETDAELKKAYKEMLDGCLKNTDQWEWYAMWIIELRDGTHIGDLCFKGLGENGVVEIGYGILEEYQGQGYAAEAIGEAAKADAPVYGGAGLCAGYLRPKAAP